MIFPEINYDQVEQIHGMDITFVTTTTKDDQALALLHELGMPFRREEKGGEGREAGHAATTFKATEALRRELQMARKQMVEKSKRQPKSRVRQRNRCSMTAGRGRSRDVRAVAHAFREHGAERNDSGRSARQAGRQVIGQRRDGGSTTAPRPQFTHSQKSSGSRGNHRNRTYMSMTDPIADMLTRIRNAVRIEASPRRHAGIEDEDSRSRGC